MLSRASSGSPVRARVAPGVGKGAALARVAGQLCANKRFQEWVIARAGAVPHGVATSEYAADYIRRACGILSRSELDHNAQAAALFHDRIRKPFLKWSGTYA
ncbi:hypothetical protein BOTU111921_10510 [Bordetella tumbae]|uniref:hypothetical protein n=1 Tax=Bordetella tumbae TaxID=1649139 RepID=UPI0039F11C71